ncbi:hypothetical protein NDU88_000976 [Pleurodeles waltl]|uniref:Uncharacterized protein n=1 Tax=Pleurodeles waltl TaxID=8319 RepID=A0AAV7P2H7_PLEWA|nr:hypothetical protein NDU88_000976 [Pleurodeles waltl]
MLGNGNESSGAEGKKQAERSSDHRRETTTGSIFVFPPRKPPWGYRGHLLIGASVAVHMELASSGFYVRTSSCPQPSVFKTKLGASQRQYILEERAVARHCLPTTRLQHKRAKAHNLYVFTTKKTTLS